MDMKQLAEIVAQDEEPVVVPVHQKNGEPYLALDGTPSTITVVGTESKRYMAAEDAHRKRLFGMMRKSGGQTLDPKVSRWEDVRLLSAAVIDWHGWDDGKKELPCTPEAVQELLRFRHIFDQVKAGVEGHADFFMANSAD